MESEARRLHAKAANARETGNVAEALHLSDDALLAYHNEEDDLGFSEVLADRSITFRTYNSEQNNRRFLIVSKYELMASVEIAKESEKIDAVALPLYNLAKVQEELGEMSEAIKSYSEAVLNMEQNPPDRHNRPAVLLDMKIHMKACEFKNGVTEARDTLETLVNELATVDEESRFSKDVWLSGGYMKLAEAYKDDIDKARSYLNKAKEISDANPELILRKKQLEQFNASLT